MKIAPFSNCQTEALTRISGVQVTLTEWRIAGPAVIEAMPAALSGVSGTTDDSRLGSLG